MGPYNRIDALISVGSNIDREKHLPEAVRLLRRHRAIDVIEVSRVFESPSIGGGADAPDFYNAAVRVCTGLEPKELRDELRHIEEVLERTGWNITHAAKILKIDRVTVYNKIKKYDLHHVKG